MRRAARFLIYADGAVFGEPAASLEEAQERAFKLLQKHQRVHVESRAPRRRYWRYDVRALAWREADIPVA